MRFTEFLILFFTFMAVVDTQFDDFPDFWRPSSANIAFRKIGDIKYVSGNIAVSSKIDVGAFIEATNNYKTRIRQERRDAERALHHTALGEAIHLLGQQELELEGITDRAAILVQTEEPQHHVIKKRSIWDFLQPVGVISDFVSAGLNIWRAVDQVNLRKEQDALYQDNKVIHRDLDDVHQTLTRHGTAIELMAQRFHRATGLINEQLQEHGTEIRWLHFANYNQAFINTAHNTFYSIQEAINIVGAGRTPMQLFNPTALPELITNVTRQAAQVDMFPLIKYPAQLSQCESSYYIQDQVIHVIVYIPLVKRTDTFTLYKYVPLPQRVSEHVYTAIVAPKDIIAINTDRSLFQALDMAQLVACEHREGSFVCTDMNVFRKTEDLEPEGKDDELCLANLFYQEFDAISRACNVAITGPLNTVTPLTDTSFMVATKDPHQGHVFCPGEERTTVSMDYTAQINTKAGCELQTKQHTIYAAASLHTQTVPVQYKWTPNPASLLPGVDATRLEELMALNDDLNVQLSPMNRRQTENYVQEMTSFTLQRSTTAYIIIILVSILAIITTVLIFVAWNLRQQIRASICGFIPNMLRGLLQAPVTQAAHQQSGPAPSAPTLKALEAPRDLANFY